MSDLYCAARLVLVPTGSATPALAATFVGRRVASVYAGDDPGAPGLAGSLADELGVRLTASPDLRPTGADEAPADVVERHRRRLEEIADLHRGETVLVLADRSALDVVVPSLVGRGAEVTGVVELENDADGWVLV